MRLTFFNYFHAATVANWVLSCVKAPDIWIDLGAGEGGFTHRLLIDRTCPRKIAVDVWKYHHRPEALIQRGWELCESDAVRFIEGYIKGQAQCELHSQSEVAKGKRILVSLFDVIEHYDKGEGLSLLETIEANFQMVMVFTPNGFFRQDAFTHPMIAHDPHMFHRSGWSDQEFVERGYTAISLPLYHGELGAVLAFRDSQMPSADRVRFETALDGIYKRESGRLRSILFTLRIVVPMAMRNAGWYPWLRRLLRRPPYRSSESV